MSNNRIYWAIEELAFAPDGSQTFTPAHGIQSVGMTTTYPLLPAQEVGQLQVYQLLEDVPDVTMQIDKVLDGYAPVYCLATQGATGPSLAGRSNAKVTAGFSIWADTLVSASGNPIAELQCSGLFCSNVGFNFNTDGFFTENVTLVGTAKTWKTSAFTYTGGFAGNNDQPLAISSGWNGVQRRQDLLFYPIYNSGYNNPIDTNGQAGASNNTNRFTVLPPDIPGISTSGTNDQTNGVFGAHIKSISTTANLGRTPLYELGRRFYYFRYVNFPVEVSTNITVTAHTGDLLNVSEAGSLSGNNLRNWTIKVADKEGLFIDCGPQNKLNSINYSGGDVSGANVEISFNYTTYNYFTVYHVSDPSGF